MKTAYWPILIILLSLLIEVTIKAEILYSGVLNLSDSEYHVDFNGDGSNDVKLAWNQIGFGPGFARAGLKAYSEGEFSAAFLCNTDGYWHPFPGPCEPLKQITAITEEPAYSNLTWGINQNDWMLYYTHDMNVPTNYYSGTWNEVGFAYLGVKLTTTNETYFGYIQLYADTNGIALVDYAFEQEPDTWIYCGATSSNSFATLTNPTLLSNQFHFAATFMNAGASYTLQKTTNLLNHSSWLDMESISATAQTTNLNNSTEDRSQEFYRLYKN